MSRSVGARAKLDRTPLTEWELERSARKLLPAKSETPPVAYRELLDELRHFGISTRGQLRRLLIKHRRAMRQADRDAVRDSVYLALYRRDFGAQFVSDRLRRQYWFGWEAMVRTALEAEHGAEYQAFARRRDAL